MKMSDRIEARVQNAIKAAAAMIERSAKMKIQQAPRGGKNLNSKGERRSAPGEPPATETGNLANSIQQEVVSDGIIVFVGAEYGKALEEGARSETGSLRIAPRPFWAPAVEDGKRILQKKLKQ
ncbi:MAG: hypothetical protein J5758_04870 [Abditibacteriota bacterium]|nr:hypothetical protein [Abditibacteriota bacterium]